MSNLTLDEVSALLKNTEDAFAHMDEILEFSQQVDDAATEIFKAKDTEYSRSLLAMVQALSITVLTTRGDISISQALQIIDNDLFTKYTVIVMKMTVGLSAMEELR